MEYIKQMGHIYISFTISFSLVYIFCLLIPKLEKIDKIIRDLIVGLAFGIISVITGYLTTTYTGMVNIDGKSLFIGLAGTFFGPVASMSTLIITFINSELRGVLYDYIIGGGIVAFIVGIFFNKLYQKNGTKKAYWYLLWLNICIYGQLFIWTFFVYSPKFLSEEMNLFQWAIYMILPIISYGIGVVVVHELVRYEVMSKLKEQEQKLKRYAYYDRTTGLKNRHRFFEKCEKYFGSSKGTIYSIDVDNFKLINDTMGHLQGDLALKEIGNRIKGFASEEFTFHFGGDEFVIVCPELIDESKILSRGQDIIKVFETPLKLEENYFNLTISLGAVIYPRDGIYCEELMQKADAALYRAKEQGKNGIVLYSEKMKDEILEKIKMQLELKTAISNGEIEVHYQPQFKKDGSNLKGFEALVRWHSKKYGYVSPVVFIKEAEECGIINEIGDFVLREAAIFAKEINLENENPIIISVNISSIQLMNSEFVQNILSVVEKVGVENNLIGLEITESILMDSFQENISKIEELKNKGFKIALDDFGTGYSSLNYLRSIPANVIKIDKSFIDGIENDDKYRKLTKAIIDICHDLELKVVAEGIETSTQQNILNEMKCDYLQGYLLGRPVKKTEAIKMR